MMNMRNTEDKLFTGILVSFSFLVLASFATTDAYAKNIKEENKATAVATAKSGVNPSIATVVVIGKRLHKDSYKKQ